MKLFVYEHITSGALAGKALPVSLAEEGNAMLTAIVQDLSQISQLEIILLRDGRLEPITNHAQNTCVEYYWVENPNQFSLQWRQCLLKSETALIIAPETEQQLVQIQQDVLDHERMYLGCSQQSTSICSDKLRCYQYLSTHNILTPDTYHAAQWMTENIEFPTQFIIKPFDGAGCLDTLLFDNSSDARRYLKTLSTDMLARQIVQPYISGKPISISLFISKNEILLLSINEQNISNIKQRLTFERCNVGIVPELVFSRSNAQKIAGDIYHAIPGLWGFIGIDLVLSSSGPVIIEVNPRMTTSYIGLNEILDYNPATLLIENMPETLNKKIA